MENNNPSSDSITALVAAPSAPGKPSGSPGNGRVFLNWTAPTSDGGAAITDYIIQMKITGPMGPVQDVFTTVVDGTSSATSATIQGLTNGVNYVFRVRAVNAQGFLGEFSEVSNNITPATVPSAPIWLSYTPFNGYVDLRWSISLLGGNGGSPITDYIVQYKVNGQPDASFVTVNDGVSTTSNFSLTGLTNGVSYRFRVAAVNAFGISPYSLNTPAILFASVPSKPAAPTATRGDSQITINWTVPDNGGSQITDYVIQRKLYTEDDSKYITINDGVSVNTYYTNTGLTNGTLYVFRIAAVNSRGIGQYSDASIPVKPATVPNAPTGLSAIANNDGTIRLSWIQPSDGGATITDYRIVGKLSSQSDLAYTIIEDGVSSSNTAVVSRTPPGPFVFKVAAINGRGAGPYSVASNTVNSLPGVPSNLVATPTGNGQITLTWTAPSNGGSPITDYVVQFSSNGGTSWTTYNDGVSSNNTVVVNELQYTFYVFRVAAKNSIGTGSWSNPSQSTRPYALFNKNSWRNVPQPWRDYLNEASDRWARFIQFDPSITNYIINNVDPGWNGIQLKAIRSDGKPGFQLLTELPTVGSNGIWVARTTDHTPLRISSNNTVIGYNTFDFALEINLFFQNRSRDWWINNVITHELGHALGIGVYWSYTALGHPPVDSLLDGSFYIRTQTAYNAVAGVLESSIPVENEGGGGTISKHWEDNFRPKSAPLVGGYPGLRDELMIGTAGVDGSRRVLSVLSINHLIDLTYQEVNPGANEGLPLISTGVNATKIFDQAVCKFDPNSINMENCININLDKHI